jgi:hypothetical protein
MNTGSTKIAAAGLAALTFAGAVAMGSTPAAAKSDVYSPYRPAWNQPYRGGRYWGHHYRGYGAGPVVGALIGGAAAGALAAPYYGRSPYYYEPGPYYYGPGPYYGW